MSKLKKKKLNFYLVVEPHVGTNWSITSEIAIEAINLHRKFIRIQIQNLYGLSEPSEQELVVKNTSRKTIFSIYLLYYFLSLTYFKIYRLK